MLSNAGKEVLLKAITMALPTYAMSCFKLPGKLCKDISAMMARYWWGEDKGKKKMHWCSWSKLTKDKGRGGMGFRDLQNFNKALLGKQLWRLVTCPNLLLSKVMKAKYFPDRSLFQCKVSPTASGFGRVWPVLEMKWGKEFGENWGW